MITRQNKERQRNLTHHAEDQHVFAMRHSGVAVLTFFITANFNWSFLPAAPSKLSSEHLTHTPSQVYSTDEAEMKPLQADAETEMSLQAIQRRNWLRQQEGGRGRAQFPSSGKQHKGEPRTNYTKFKRRNKEKRKRKKESRRCCHC